MMIEPTVEQANQCVIVQQEIVEAVNRLLAEGMPMPVVLAGLSAATAATVLKEFGPEAVPKWFAKQTALSMGLSKQWG